MKLKPKSKIASYCRGTKLTAEIFTFSAFGIIHLTLWHFTTMQVKHTSKHLHDGPGEKSPWHIWCCTRQRRWLWRRLCFLGNLNARKPNTHTRPNAAAQERKHLSSTHCQDGYCAHPAFSSESKQCRLSCSLLSTLSNEHKEMCAGRSDWRCQLISGWQGDLQALDSLQVLIYSSSWSPDPGTHIFGLRGWASNV